MGMEEMKGLWWIILVLVLNVVTADEVTTVASVPRNATADSGTVAAADSGLALGRDSESDSNGDGNYYFSQTLHAQCDDTKKPCPNGLLCVDYGMLYPFQQAIKVCDCEEPTTKDRVEGCYCNSTHNGITNLYRRWKHQEANTKNPPDDPLKKRTFPMAGQSRVGSVGCYLERGEICKLAYNSDPDLPPHTICRHGHVCKKITKTYGFCRFADASSLFVSSALLQFALVVQILILK